MARMRSYRLQSASSETLRRGSTIPRWTGHLWEGIYYFQGESVFFRAGKKLKVQLSFNYIEKSPHSASTR